MYHDFAVTANITAVIARIIIRACYVILFSVRNINFNNNLVNLTNVKLVFKKYDLVLDPQSFYN